MGHYREILPQMVTISNNSRLTNEVANTIAEKLSPEDFKKFQDWLKLVESESKLKTNRTKINRFGHP
jgi:hypothetical protein